MVYGFPKIARSRRFPELSDNCSGAGGQSFILAQQCAPGVKVRSQRQALAGLQ